MSNQNRVPKSNIFDTNVQINGVGFNELDGLPVLNVMGSVHTGGVISLWIEDHDGEAALDLSRENAIRLKLLLEKAIVTGQNS